MWESSNNSNSPPVWKSNFNWSRIHKRSGLQRRLIHALPVNLEIDLFEGQNKKTCRLHSPVCTTISNIIGGVALLSHNTLKCNF